MRAVNLVPGDARSGRTRSAGSPAIRVGSFGPAQFLVLLVVIVVALVLLRVFADNTVNNKKATLAAVQQQVATEQAEASELSQYVTLVDTIQQREEQVKAIAEQRFDWKRTLDQISHVLPGTTSLNTLNATTSGPTTANGTAGGPSIALTGCADTPNQNGVATLLRRLTQVTAVTNVGFGSSTRTTGCGNSFNVTLSFAAPGTTATGVTTSGAPTTTTSATTTTPGATTPGATTTTTGTTG